MNLGPVPLLLVVIVLSPALALVVVRRGRRALAAACLSLAAWAASVWLTLRPETAALGERLLMVGFFVPAAFHHAADEDLGRAGLPGRPRGVLASYAVAAVFTLVGMAAPDLFLRQAGTLVGPGFLPMFATAAALSGWPLVRLARALSTAPAGARERHVYLLLATLLCTFGGGFNVLQLLTGHPSAAGLTMVLGGLVLLSWLVQVARLPGIGRFVERSLRYAVGAALISAGYVFGLLVFLRPAGEEPAWTWGSWSGGLLLFVLVLAGQPLVGLARGWLAGRLFPGQGDVAGMARALAESEARAEHAGRLAEIGTLASAVAHEVRNPLGVISAATRVLERQGADAATTGEIKAQVARAARFADELLEYGRPAPLQRRPVDVRDAAEIASGEVQRAQERPGTVEVVGEPITVQADLVQIIRLIGIVVDNALRSAGRARVHVGRVPGGARITIEDDGPGVAAEINPRLFHPFVTGRRRNEPRPGTGLGLAIARGIAERHGGAVRYEGRSQDLGGACFVVDLPAEPPLPAGL